MNLKKNYIYNTINLITSVFISLFILPYISRTLGPENIGIYSYSYTISSYFVMLIVLGLANYGNREIAKSKDKDIHIKNKTFSSIYYFQLSMGISVLIIYYIYIYLFIKDHKIIFNILSLHIFSSIIDVSWAVNGLELFKSSSIRGIIVNLISLILIFLNVKSENDLNIYVLIVTLTGVVTQIINWAIISKHLKLIKVNIKSIIRHIKPNLILFIPVLAVSVYKMMDKIMIGKISNLIQLGFYENSEKLIRIPTLLISSLGTVMLPRMSNLFARGDNKSIEKYISFSLIFAVGISSVLCFGLMGTSKEVIEVLFGENFKDSINVFILLLPSCIFLAFSNVIRTQYLIPNHKDSIFVKAVIYGAIVNFLSNIFLIKQYEASGAAIGTLLAESTVCIYQIIAIRKSLNIYKYIKSVLPYILSGLIMFIILFNINIYLPIFLRLIFKSIFGGIVYLVLILFYIFTFRPKEYFYIQNKIK